MRWIELRVVVSWHANIVDSEPTSLVIPTAMASTRRQAQLDLLSGRKCTSYPPTRVLVDC
jgi:hypothetical protein